MTSVVAPHDELSPQRVMAAVENGTVGSSSTLECDYDVNPTYLYQAIEARQWDHCRKVFSKPNAHVQCATWVTRKEHDGKLRWRLLPVHSAVIFGAPLDVMELLLTEYPHGAQCKDDQGMLPLHLAFRNESDWDVLEELLTAHPQAIMVKDRKGRLPLQCASSRTAKQATVMELYSQIAVSSERQKAVQESRSVLEARVSSLQDTHVKTLQRLKSDWESQMNLLREELDKTKEELDVTWQSLQETKTSEKEVTNKLREVTIALQTVDEARTVEHRLERDALQGREQQLVAANEELLLLVQSLLDQQTSLKVQLDKQAWEAKDKDEARSKLWKEMMALQQMTEAEIKSDRDAWRQALQESNEHAATKLRQVLIKTKEWQAQGGGQYNNPPPPPPPTNGGMVVPPPPIDSSAAAQMRALSPHTLVSATSTFDAGDDASGVMALRAMSPRSTASARHQFVTTAASSSSSGNVPMVVGGTAATAAATSDLSKAKDKLASVLNSVKEMEVRRGAAVAATQAQHPIHVLPPGDDPPGEGEPEGEESLYDSSPQDP